VNGIHKIVNGIHKIVNGIHKIVNGIHNCEWHSQNPDCESIRPPPGQQCGDASKPGVYTRISAYRDWIQEVVYHQAVATKDRHLLPSIIESVTKTPSSGARTGMFFILYFFTLFLINC